MTPSPKATFHPSSLLPVDNSTPSHPSLCLSGRCQNPPAKGQWQPRVSIPAGERGLWNDQWLLPAGDRGLATDQLQEGSFVLP